MSWIVTFTGREVPLCDPRPEHVCPRDIAHALAHICRYTGHSCRYHSVAEHSVGVMQHVPDPLRLEALLHDATEAYLGDVSTPLKALLPEYRALENRWDDAIRARFGLPRTASAEVKRADRLMLAIERAALLPESPTPWPVLEGVALPQARQLVGVLSARDAEAVFLAHLQHFGLWSPA